MKNHFSTQYTQFKRNHAEQKIITACGNIVSIWDVWFAYLTKVECSQCLASQEYKDALYELEIGFDGNELAYEDYIFK